MSSVGIETYLNKLKHVLGADLAALSDQQLLQQFLHGGDENAFRAILQRYGPMVWRTCQRTSDCDADAEDAFQAVFLQLLCRGNSIRRQHSLAAWLHAVAQNAALTGHQQNAARHTRERRRRNLPSANVPEEAAWGEVRGLLDQELQRLPAQLREPLVLCFLDSLTQDQAAQRIGCSTRTLSRRLQQAKVVLGRRLRNRGLTPATTFSALLVSECTLAAQPPLTLLTSLDHAAKGIRAGRPFSTVVPATVTEMMNGALTMTFTKLSQRTLTVFIVACLLGFGYVGLMASTTGHKGRPKAEPKASSSAVRQASTVRATAPTASTPNQQAIANKKSDHQLLQGAWTMVFPKESVGQPKTRWIIKRDTIYCHSGDVRSSGRWQFRLKPERKPAEIYLTYLDGQSAGKTTPAIYQVDHRTLMVFQGGAGKNPPSAFPKQLPKAGSSGALYVLKREPTEHNGGQQPPARKKTLEAPAMVLGWPLKGVYYKEKRPHYVEKLDFANQTMEIRFGDRPTLTVVGAVVHFNGDAKNAEVIIDGKKGRFANLIDGIAVNVALNRKRFVNEHYAIDRIETVHPWIDGDLVGMDVRKRVLTVSWSETRTGQVLRKEFEAVLNVEVTIDGKGAKLRDLRDGMPISVRMSAVNPIVLGVTAVGPKVDCLLKSVDSRTNTLAVTIPQTQLNVEEVAVVKGARITINGRPGELADLRPGQPVTLQMAADPKKRRLIVGITAR